MRALQSSGTRSKELSNSLHVCLAVDDPFTCSACLRKKGPAGRLEADARDGFACRAGPPSQVITHSSEPASCSTHLSCCGSSFQKNTASNGDASFSYATVESSAMVRSFSLESTASMPSLVGQSVRAVKGGSLHVRLADPSFRFADL